jgi:hypothetical protein
MFAGDLIGPMIACGVKATRLTDRVPRASSVRSSRERPLERHDAGGVLIACARPTMGGGT